MRTSVTVDGIQLTKQQVENAYKQLQSPRFGVGDIVRVAPSVLRSSSLRYTGIVIDTGGQVGYSSVAQHLRTAYGPIVAPRVRIIITNVENGDGRSSLGEAYSNNEDQFELVRAR